MWFSKRKYPSKAELSIVESWAVSQRAYKGKPLIVRTNKGVTQAVGHPEFSHQVGVAVPLRDPDPNGFPGASETEELNQIEDLLAARLEAGRQCLHVATISTGGMREFVFYTSDPGATHALLEELAKEVASHELQHIIQPDPKWNVYRQFA